MTTHNANNERDRLSPAIRSRAQAFEALGLKPDASQQRIHRRFRRMAFRYHPDRNRTQSAADIFKRASEAYQFLRTYNACNVSHCVDDEFECVCRKCNRVSKLHAGLDRNLYCRDCLLSIDGHRGLPAPPIVMASFALAMAILFGSCVTFVAYFVTGGSWLAWMTILLASVSFILTAATAIAVELAAQPRRPRHRRTFFT